MKLQPKLKQINYLFTLLIALLAVIISFAGCKKTDTSDLISFDIENTKPITVNFDDIFEIDRIVILEETVIFL
ncbi:MAG: hypothetical protein RQ743_09290 [Bacteroidales bacterium]|nr:hypothetical protein [Bacteroidales bacterium]